MTRASNSLMHRFAADLGFASYADLHRWSVSDVDAFWTEVTRFLNVRWHNLPTCAVENLRMPGANWFPGGTLNFTEHALARMTEAPHDVAVIERGQTRAGSQLTWTQLADLVHRCAAGLKAQGVTRGDHVAAYSPNIIETLVAFLATAQLGAVWSSCAPEFGPRAVIDRLSQFEPTVFIHIDGYRYGAKEIDRSSDVAMILDALPSVRTTVPLRYLGVGPDGWTSLLDHDPVRDYTALGFEHPLYVLYSSGTTGLPKPIVHSHVGITVEHLVALALHLDLKPHDRFFWFTTTGWMMWNLLVSGLMTGSALVLYDGDPSHGDLYTLWSMADDTRTTVFGASAGFFMNCRKAGLHPPRGHIRLVGSTGAPLPLAGFEWITNVLGDVPVNSTSGGTDVCSSFVGWNPMSSVVAGEIVGAMLGRDVAAFDATGAPCPTGVQGELVVRTPMPSMPLGFLGDEDGSRYVSTYFARYPGVWCQGDWITLTEPGGCVISGRSDATLNRGGVRLGSSDFYAVVESLPEVLDSLVVHQDEDGRDELHLFLVLGPGVEFDDALQYKIRGTLRQLLSPRHVPDVIAAAPSIPRTLSGKKLELPVKKILGGSRSSEVLSNESLSDPQSIEWFERFASERAH